MSREDMDPISWLPPAPWEGLPPLFGAPWERQEQTHEEPRAPIASAPARSQPKPLGPHPMSPGGPGCRAADNGGTALYHLDGLGYHWKTNFGVLRVTKVILEEGARAAETAGDPRIAEEYRAIAQDLPQVHDAAQAREVAEQLRPVAFRAWELGARCEGGHVTPQLTPEDLTKARSLAQQVHEGTLTMDQAIKQVREER